MCNKEKFWPVLCDMIGRPDLAAHPDFRTFKDRLANRQKLTALLDALLSQRTTAEWLSHFAGRVPAAPVNDVAAALDNPFVRQGGRIWNVAHPARADFKMVAAPYTCAGDELPRRPAPALGEDTDRSPEQMWLFARTHRNAASTRRYLSFMIRRITAAAAARTRSTSLVIKVGGQQELELIVPGSQVKEVAQLKRPIQPL